MQRPRPPFDPFRHPSPQPLFNEFLPPRQRFEMAAPRCFPGAPPFFMPPPFLPNAHRPFLPNFPRQPHRPFNHMPMQPPGEPLMFPPNFRSPPMSQIHRSPFPQSQHMPPQLRPSSSTSSLAFAEDGYQQNRFQTPSHHEIQSFSKRKSSSESNLASCDFKAGGRFPDKWGVPEKRKYAEDRDNQIADLYPKRARESYKNEMKAERNPDASNSQHNNNNNYKHNYNNPHRNNNYNNNHNNSNYTKNSNYIKTNTTKNPNFNNNNKLKISTNNSHNNTISSPATNTQSNSHCTTTPSRNTSNNNSNTNINEEEEERRIEREAREWQALVEEYKEEEEEQADWLRCSHADLCFKRNSHTQHMESTHRMKELERRFEWELLHRASRVREDKPDVVMPERYYNKYKKKKRRPDNKVNHNNAEDDDDGDNDGEDDGDDDDGDEVGDDDDDDDDDECDNKMSIIAWKNQHPELLHSEMWYNLPGEMNDGPLCRCSKATRKHGIRHNIYPGEEALGACKPHHSNAASLFHYKVTMSPHTNFLTKNPTVIKHDDHEYIFEGFSLFSHYKIQKVPSCKVIRFNIEYTIHCFEEDMIENFDVRGLDLFSDYLYREVLELVDLDWIGKHCEGENEREGEGGGGGEGTLERDGAEGEREGGGEGNTEGHNGKEGDGDGGKARKSRGCRAFHIMPRFSRNLPENGKEILSMSEVLAFMLESNRPLLDELQLQRMPLMTEQQWQEFVDEVRGMIVTYPGKRPSSLRIDQLDRTQASEDTLEYPKIIHFGYRPAQLSYVGDAVYSKLFKQYMKLKYLVANKPKLSAKDREKLRCLENQLQEIRLKGWLKREMTVEVSSESFHRTGLKSDICQHALLLPVLLQHLRFHKCLDVLEDNIGHRFKDRLYLQMAMTHPSFRMNYGTNPDHARNSLSNCGMRQLQYGDRHIHYMHTRKRGIKTLIHIMSKMARVKETASEIHHYERLEFLGDTVIEFLSSIHLFFLFPRLEEGGLATFRAALVQNQHLTVLAQKLGLQHFLLYAHGPDLCRDSDLRYALANCFEALMGSLYLDAGIEEADRVFGEALFKGDAKLHHVWTNLPCHRLQGDEPMGDRHWIEKSKPLQKLVEFEESSGIRFKHIRLLARAFTMRNIGYNNLSLGHNQTLEFLGDTILQFITSEYLFKHFPDHHEGHLTLLRSSLVNNKTQAIICDDLGMTPYVINNDPKVKERMENEKNKVKDKADILEAFMGALYVDQGLDPCIVFCQVCFYPRLKEFIMNQDWNDAKSQLQQCCLTLRDPTEGEPDIPIYKVLQCTGPTNTRKYHVAVYFKGERLATGVGHSIQQGEMEAATNALKQNSDMFPHLLQTKQYLDWRFNKYFNSHVENNSFTAKPTQSRFKTDKTQPR